MTISSTHYFDKLLKSCLACCHSKVNSSSAAMEPSGNIRFG